MPNKGSGDENCDRKRKQSASGSKGKGQNKKVLAVRKSPRKRIQEEEVGANGRSTEGEQSDVSDAESMASRVSQASKSSQSKPKSKSSSASASRRAIGVPMEEITQEQMQMIADFYEGHQVVLEPGLSQFIL